MGVFSAPVLPMKRASFPPKTEATMVGFLAVTKTPSVTPRPDTLSEKRARSRSLTRPEVRTSVPALVSQSPSPSPAPVDPKEKSAGPMVEMKAPELQKSTTSPQGSVSPKDVPTVRNEKPAWLKEGARIQTVAEFKSGRAIGTEGEIRCWNDKVVKIFWEDTKKEQLMGMVSLYKIVPVKEVEDIFAAYDSGRSSEKSKRVSQETQREARDISLSPRE